ncbi:MAG: ferritin family protein [Nitrospirota bacterium]|jgi:rubrerythrin
MNLIKSEVLAVAQKIEEDGIAFYKAIAPHTKDLKARAVFYRLAHDEALHLDGFSALLKVPADDNAYDDAAMLTSYVQETIRSDIFPSATDARRIARAADGLLAAVDLGLQAERQSVAFYERMVTACTNEEGKAAFAELLAAEREHVATLEGLRRTVQNRYA